MREKTKSLLMLFALPLLMPILIWNKQKGDYMGLYTPLEAFKIQLNDSGLIKLKEQI